MSAWPPAPPPRARGLLKGPGWRPEVRAALEDVLAAPAEALPIAVFDWDETAIRGDISEMLLALLAERSGLDLVTEYEAACAVDLRAAYVELVHTLCAGRTEAEVRSLAFEALSEGTRRGRVAIRESMRELIWALQRHGWDVWVVTASAEPLVQAIAGSYGVHPHRVVGMRSPVDPDGRYLPKVLDPVTWREGKALALALALGRTPTLVVGDSQGDAPMMRSARYALLVDRGDPALGAEAAERGWWIQPAGDLG